MNEFEFGFLSSLIEDPLITDINYNGRQLWVDHLQKGRYVIEQLPDSSFFEQLGFKFANFVNLPFNAVHPVVEAETDQLRISIIHSSVSSQISISIRKTPAVLRLTPALLKKQRYAPSWLLALLAKWVVMKCNIIVSGLPGAGKTELLKYLMQYIDPAQRVITIEDTCEIRYRDLFPNSDSVSLKVSDRFDYCTAIKTCLRQRPDWMLVSEVRSHEIVSLLQSVSTGASLLSTIHASSAKAIPLRILHMFPGVELSNDVLLMMIYDTLDIGIHVEASITKKGIRRYIREVVCYSADEGEPRMINVYKIDESEEPFTQWPLKLMEKARLYKYRTLEQES
jgi:pilus assembly protein CpaF